MTMTMKSILEGNIIVNPGGVELYIHRFEFCHKGILSQLCSDQSIPNCLNGMFVFSRDLKQ